MEQGNGTVGKCLKWNTFRSTSGVPAPPGCTGERGRVRAATEGSVMAQAGRDLPGPVCAAGAAGPVRGDAFSLATGKRRAWGRALVMARVLSVLPDPHCCGISFRIEKKHTITSLCFDFQGGHSHLHSLTAQTPWVLSFVQRSLHTQAHDQAEPRVLKPAYCSMPGLGAHMSTVTCLGMATCLCTVTCLSATYTWVP